MIKKRLNSLKNYIKSYINEQNISIKRVRQ